MADAEIEKFKGEFQKKYNHEPDVYSAYAYDALRMISKAIQKGGYTSEGIKTALYEMKDFKGVTGITSLDNNGEADKPFYIYVVKNGKFELFQ